MPLPAILAGVGAAVGLGKSLFGLAQLLGNKRPETPDYQIPEEVSRMVDMYMRRSSQETMPGYDILQGQIGGATAEAYKNARERGVYDVGGIFEKNLESQRELALQNAGFKLQSEDKYAAALQKMADEKEKEWIYEKLQPYQQKLADFYSTRQTGVENIFGGISGAVSSGMGYVESKQMQELIDRLYPKTDSGTKDTTGFINPFDTLQDTSKSGMWDLAFPHGDRTAWS